MLKAPNVNESGLRLMGQNQAVLLRSATAAFASQALGGDVTLVSPHQILFGPPGSFAYSDATVGYERPSRRLSFGLSEYNGRVGARHGYVTADVWFMQFG